MKPFNHMSAYEFSEWKMSHMTKSDPEKLAFAVNAVVTAMSILETIDDEYMFPTHEYETLQDIRTDLTNMVNDNAS